MGEPQREVEVSHPPENGVGKSFEVQPLLIDDSLGALSEYTISCFFKGSFVFKGCSLYDFVGVVG